MLIVAVLHVFLVVQALKGAAFHRVDVENPMQRISEVPWHENSLDVFFRALS